VVNSDQQLSNPVGLGDAVWHEIDDRTVSGGSAFEASNWWDPTSTSWYLEAS
jgi:hypothetical protein